MQHTKPHMKGFYTMNTNGVSQWRWFRQHPLLVAGLIIGLLGSGLLLTGAFFGGSAHAQGDCGIAGVVNVDRTLSPTECDPYIVTGNLIVDEGITLTIEPGTTLSFDGEWSITVRGTLIAQGTASNKITFTSGQDTPAPGDWSQIVFERTSPPATFDAQGTYTGGNVLQHVIVEYGGGDIRSGDAVIWADETTFYLDQSTIQYSASGGVIQGSFGNAMRVTSCEFQYNAGTALSIENTDIVVITNTNIYTNGGGVVLGRSNAGSTFIFQDNLVQNNLDSREVVFGRVRFSGTMHIIRNRVISNTGGLSLNILGAGTGLVLDNIVRDNRSTGMELDFRSSSSPGVQATVSGNQISGNEEREERFVPGGMNLSVSGDDPYFITVTNNVLFNNTALEGGGGMRFSSWLDPDSSLLVEENTFQGNHATSPNGGGAVVINTYSDEGRYSFTNNEFIGNTATAPDDPDTPPTQRVPQDIYNSVRSNEEPFNARGNFWGTDDRAEIQARIYDGADDTGRAFVDFEDFRLESPRSEQPQNPDEDGTLESADGAVMMTIPGTAITAPTTVTHRILTVPTLPLPAGTTPRYSFSTSARIADGGGLDRFAAPITLVIDVPAVLAQTGETGLNVAYRDGVEWVNLLPCEGCSISDTQVTLVTDRLGEFALVDVSDTGGGDNQLYLPLIRK